MPNLLELKDYAEVSNNEEAIYVIQKYLNMSKDKWALGSYYLGGQIMLKLEDDITIDIIKQVQSLLHSAECWFDIIPFLEQKDVNIIVELIYKLKRKKRVCV